MKDKRIVLIAGVMVALCTAVLFVAVFSAQEVRAQQPLAAAIEEQQPEGQQGLDPQPAAASTGEKTEKTLPIGPPPLPQKELKAEEAVFPNWIVAEPGAADIPEEQAVGNAVLVAQELFKIEEPLLKGVQFYKDMTGQRGNYWGVEFVDDGLGMGVDALTGNVYVCYSERFERGQVFDSPEEYHEATQLIWHDEQDGGGEFHDAVKAIASDYLPGGGIKNTMLNAVHGDGKHHDAVSIYVEMQDGTSYDVECIKDGASGEIMLYRMSAFPDWEHLWGCTAWHADMLYDQMVELTYVEPEEGPAVEPEPTPTPGPQPVPSTITGTNIAEAAKAQIGKPYERQYHGPDKFSPAGLLYFALDSAGVDVDWEDACAVYAGLEGHERVEDMDGLAPGDVLFFHGDSGEGSIAHAGVYIGDGCMVHASSSNAEVVKARLDTDYWERNFSHALRFERRAASRPTPAPTPDTQ